MAGTFTGMTTLTACEVTTGFTASTGSVGTSSPGPQGTNFIYHYFNPGIDGDEYIQYDDGSPGVDMSGANRFLFVWQYNSKGNKRNKDATNPGWRIRLTDNGGSNYKEWNIQGYDTNVEANFLNGFRLVCIDPAATADQSSGTLSTSSIRYIRFYVNYSTDYGLGAYTFLDHFGYGAGITCTGGGSAVSPLDLSDFQDYSKTNGWGVTEVVGTVYTQLGSITFDSSASDLHFNEQGKTLFFLEARGSLDNERGIYDSSNPPEIVVDESSTNDTNFVLGNETTEVSGCVLTNDVERPIIKCDTAVTKFKILGCTILNFDWDITGTANPTIKNTVLNNCGEFPLGTRTFEGNTIVDATSGVLMTTSHTSKNNTYIGCTDAIKVSDNGPITMTLDGDTFSGNTDDIHFAGTGTLTVNNTNGADASSSRVSGGGTVVIRNPVTCEVECLTEDGAAVQDVRVLLEADTGGDLPVGASVTITRSGTTATVTHTGHGLESNSKVVIRGADQQEYNSVKTITATGANTYTYTVTGSPATPATGTITSTGVLVYGTTNASGIVNNTDFDYTSDQPVTGTCRKSTSSPRYKSASLNGTCSSTGYAQTVTMILNE